MTESKLVIAIEVHGAVVKVTINEPSVAVHEPVAVVARRPEPRRGLSPSYPSDVWTMKAIEAVARLAASGMCFQAYDLIEQGLVEEPPSPQLWGALFNRAEADGKIVRVGTVPSKRHPRRRATVVSWRGRVVL
ncbi:MAG: hypothetical protein JWP11_141 [Frankiales bacterium]|nr:hypothetical protein [Frankiales bacterium]